MAAPMPRDLATAVAQGDTGVSGLFSSDWVKIWYGGNNAPCPHVYTSKVNDSETEIKGIISAVSSLKAVRQVSTCHLVII